MKLLSDLFLVIAAGASLTASTMAFSFEVWGGAFWTGSRVGRILDLLWWLIPACSIFAFLIYILSKKLGQRCAWAIAIGSLLTAICSLAAPQFSPIAFLLPALQLIACFALYGDAQMQKKIKAGLPCHKDSTLSQN